MSLTYKVKCKALNFSQKHFIQITGFYFKKIIWEKLNWGLDKAIFGEKHLCEYFLEETLPTMLEKHVQNKVLKCRSCLLHF